MWGLRPKVVHWLYISTIWLCITFASLVWWPSCQMANANKRLSSMWRLACLGITGATRTTPTGAMEALTGLPPLQLVIQGEVRWAVYHLWSLGCWSYLHPTQGHNSILMWLHRSDPIFNPLVPSDPYMGRTAQLTSRRCILNTYSTNIRTEYFKCAA
jgi:hypothetical protein